LKADNKGSLEGKNIVWVTRSFLDYRVPVYAELYRLLDGRLRIIYSQEFTPERAWRKLEAEIGTAAIGLKGERSIGYKGNITSESANSRLRVPFQSGLLKTIKDLKPDVVVGDGFFQWTWPAIFYRLFSGCPVVVCYERTKHTERHAQWYRTLFRKMIIKSLGAMSVNGNLSREYVESIGMPRGKITLGHMVADTESLAKNVATLPENELDNLKKKLCLQESEKIFLSVSQLIKRKGIDKLLLGWQRFVELLDVQQCVLLLVGDGPERDNLEKFFQERGIKGVKFVGNIDYDRIHKYFALADVFVISTLEDNWSLVVPEAMACGKPILCSKYNGCWPELVKEGENGWVFDPLDIESSRVAFQRAFTSDKLVEMGMVSKKIIMNHTPMHAAKAVLQACELALWKIY
jgi:glycosyltransferase involved in cell wall biosynthesis